MKHTTKPSTVSSLDYDQSAALFLRLCHALDAIGLRASSVTVRASFCFWFNGPSSATHLRGSTS